MSKLNKAPAINIIEAIHDQNLFRPFFRDLESWWTWEVFLKALFCLPMESTELGIYQVCTGRQIPPERLPREAWVVAGRRSGKSFMAALIGSYFALFRDYRPHLAPGERVHILILAADRMQTRNILNYVKGFLSGNKMFSRLVENEKTESIELKNRVSITVATSSYRSVRGYSAALVVADEVAFWADDTGSNPASETMRALRPALATIPGSLLLGISSPYSQTGPLWQVHKEHYGREESDVLVWQASTRIMNPTISQVLIDQETEADPEAARSEWEAEFRTDLESFLDPMALEAVTRPGRYELPWVRGTFYHAFVDPSGGRVDAAGLGIAHSEQGIVVLDLARKWKAPHDPGQVVGEMAEILKGYGVRQVTGDRYAGAWPEREFLKHGIIYQASQKDRSSLYLELLPMVLSGKVELLENKSLLAELRSLERRTRSGGRDSVDHPPRGKDDLANACAGALTLAAAVMAQPIEYMSVARRISMFDESVGRMKDRPDHSDDLVPMGRINRCKRGF
jgi:hypothetical protein